MQALNTQVNIILCFASLMRSAYILIKRVVDCFFIGLIVFMGCNLTCVNALC